MAISDQLTLLNNTKQAIKTSINNKGGSVTDSTPFADYSTAIDNLPSGGSGNPLLESIDVSDFTGTTFDKAASYITSITIPNGVTTIKSNAFNGYSNVKSIVLPNSVTTLQDYALSGMSGLETLYFGSGFSQQTGSYAFGYYYSNSTGLRNITVDANNSVYDSRNNCNAVIKTATNELVLGGVNTVIPNTVTKISAQAFYGRSSLTSLNIPSNVTEIEQQAFTNCLGLTSISIPDSVTVAGSRIFNGCSSLTSVTIGSGLTNISEYMFYDCSGLTSISIPNNITILNAYAFNGCTSLASVTFGNGLTTIRDQCFSGCRSLTKVVLPDNVTRIGSYVFAGCTSLTSVVFGSGTTWIGNYPFNQVSSIQNVVCKATTPPTLQNSYAFSGNYPFYVPAASVDAYKAATNWSTYASRIYPIQQVATVDGNPVYNYDLGMTSSTTMITSTNMQKMPTGTSLELAEGIVDAGGSFGNYTSITLPSTFSSFDDQGMIGNTTTTLTCLATTPPTAERDNFGGAGLTTIYVPASAVDTYKADSGWSSFASIIQAIPVPPAMKWTSADGTQETSIACEDLAEAGTFSWEDKDDADPDNLMGKVDGSAEIGDCVTTIGENAFGECSSLTSINIPDSVTTIGDSAFYNCSSLTSINIPDSVTTIGNNTFNGCTSLTSINIPDSVTTIGNNTFNGCTSLTSVTIPDSVTRIGAGSFYNCTSLTSINIPDSVTTIGIYAFSGCTSLTSINIPDSVTTIGNNTFNGCTSLTSVTVNSTTPPTLDSNAFNNTSDSLVIYVPSDSVESYKAATNWSTYADRIQAIPTE